MRLFLDVSILFSAAKSDGAVRALVRQLLDRRHECRVGCRSRPPWLPRKDRPVLATALRLECEALLTGDRKQFGSA